MQCVAISSCGYGISIGQLAAINGNGQYIWLVAYSTGYQYLLKISNSNINESCANGVMVMWPKKKAQLLMTLE